MNMRIAGFFAVLVAVFAVQAQAHHSFAMFDQAKSITVSGTLKEFEFANPHCWIHLSAVDPATGRTLDWAFEMGSTGQIGAQGWKADTVKPGDNITIQAHPMKDGSRGGQYQSATLADGRTLGPAANANPNNNTAR